MMNKKLRDLAIGAATLALLLYAAITAAKTMADSLQAPPPASACAARCGGELQLAQNRD